MTLRRIVCYSTAATSDATYIIGNIQDPVDNSPTIAEFKDDQWRKLGDLTQGRWRHGSISVGQRTMGVGGLSYG